MTYEIVSEYKLLWIILVSKIILFWFILVLIFTFIGPFIFLFLRSFSVVLFLIVFFGIPIYIIYKDNPFKWRGKLKIDFDDNLIKKDNTTFAFNDIQWINATQYEHFIFPTYYKISCQTKDKKSTSLISIKSPMKYSEILSEFSKAGLKIN